MIKQMDYAKQIKKNIIGYKQITNTQGKDYPKMAIIS